MNCGACGELHGDPVYLSGAPASVSSISTVVPAAIEVYFCEGCGHVQTHHRPEEALESFWESYHAVQAVAEDPVYSRGQCGVLLRGEHEARLTTQVLDFATGAKVFCEGGVRLATLSRLALQRPDLRWTVQIESPLYEAAVRKAVPTAQVVDAAFEGGGFDFALSYYTLAHVAEPAAALDAVGKRLAPGGKLLVAVPNLLTNPGDLVVSNHLGHFAPSTLQALLEACGWKKVSVSDSLFQGRVFATAEWKGASRRKLRKAPSEELRRKVEELGRYWTEFGDRVKAFEAKQSTAGSGAAIYGAGFYGAFILSQLRNPNSIESFYDGNCALVGKTLASIPIRPSTDLCKTKVLYVGLSPHTAKSFVETEGREPLATFVP